ncbi:hypothetical protein AJ88_14580 [Mesorhizobium amorphae CCBAU 01583]|nr:hypothetical protein AJ88_14580 [Mesorhizobium amorphae CCBAU 01583]
MGGHGRAKAAREVWATLPGITNYCSMVNIASLKVGYHSVAAVAGGEADRGIPSAFAATPWKERRAGGLARWR